MSGAKPDRQWTGRERRLADCPTFTWGNPDGEPSHLVPGRSRNFSHHVSLSVHPKAGWGSLTASEFWTPRDGASRAMRREVMLTFNRKSLEDLHAFLGEVLKK